MSLNWVMLDGPSSYIRLPREKTVFTSPARTSLALQTPNSYPGKEPLNIKCADGKAIITTQRLIYLPTTPAPTSTLQSFSAPLPSLQDTHVSAPFFGPNIWEGVCIPTPGGGISAHHQLVQIKLTFREGGAFDFSSAFERIREVVAQMGDVARNEGGGEDVGLEQLPAYEESAGGGGVQAVNGDGVRLPGGVQIQRPTPIAPNGVQRPTPRPAPAANNGVVGLEASNASTSGSSAPPPDEPPPGYEETLGNSVASNLERSVEKGG